MAKVDPNLLIEQEWSGTFYPPGRTDLSFGGRLRYSPTEGVRLEYARPLVAAERDLKWDYLHGHTTSGIPLTLVGSFSSDGSGFNMHNGLTYWSSSGYPFLYVIFGFHFDDQTTFDTFEFDISGAQEFFAPEGAKRHIPYSRTDVISAKTVVGEIKVIHTGNFEFTGNNLDAYFYSTDPAGLEEWQRAYDDIRGRRPEFRPFFRKSLDYLFRFVPDSELTVPGAFKVISRISDLFAVLFFDPAKILHLTAVARDGEGKPHPMVVFPATLNDMATIERSLEERSYHQLPLNCADVDFGSLLCSWLQKDDRFSTVTSMLQGKVSVISSHDVYGSIVLGATQLEDMAVQSGKKSKLEKFEFGLQHFASAALNRHLAKLFGCQENEIGEAISDLRNEIAHVGRPKKYLVKLNNRQLFVVAMALQTVVIGYVLEQVGVTKGAREKFQDALIG